MKKKFFSLLALVLVALTASAGLPGFELKVGTNEHGTITFKVNNETVRYATEGQTVTVVITPAEGWAVNQPSGQWIAAQANARSQRAQGIDLMKNVTLTAAGENQWTFTMQRANVEISATYKKLMTNQDITISGLADVTYNTKAFTPAVTVKDGTTTLKLNTDYTVSYANNVNAGKATVTVTAVEGSEKYAGAVRKQFTIVPATLTKLVLKDTLLTTAYKELTIEVDSVRAGSLDVPADGYTISGNKQTAVGTYTATATGKGNFQGTATAKFRIKEPAPTIDVDAMETKDEDKNVDDVKMVMNVTEDAADNTKTEQRTEVNEQTGEVETVEVTVIPIVLENIEVPEQTDATQSDKKEITVEVPGEIRDGNVVYQVTEIKQDAFKANATSNTVVTKVVLPETEEPLKIAEGAMKPENTLLDVVSPIELLDDYALMQNLKENYEAQKISAVVNPLNRYWTFSSGVDCVLPEGVTAYIVKIDNGTPRIVPLTEEQMTLADGRRGVKANNGVLVACDNGEGGNAYEIVASPGNQQSGTQPATTNANSYEGNQLEPVIVAKNYPAGDFLILKDNVFHGIMSNASKVRPCKAVLRVK